MALRLLNPRLLLGSALVVTACGASPEPAPLAASAPRRERAAARAERPRLPELSPAQIVSGLRGSESDLDLCFQSVEWAPGFVRLGWRVDESGVTSGVEVLHSSLSDASVGACLTERVEALRFGPLERPSQARWTFVRGLGRDVTPEDDRRDRKKKRKKRRLPGDDRGIAIAPSSPGFMEPVKIEEVVHAGFGLIARCYRDGLERDPALGGAVRLTFVIDERGSVARVVDGGSDLPDARVIDCVAEGLYALEFPRPRKGRVHVLYRVLFDSG